jgi:hypothetical protein
MRVRGVGVTGGIVPRGVLSAAAARVNEGIAAMGLYVVTSMQPRYS